MSLKKTRTLWTAALGLAMAVGTSHAGESGGDALDVASTEKNRVVLASEVQWEPLNPARGDQSPRAGTLWGDRNAEVPTGFLAKFVDGFSSPPHIHNVTYRAVVISGGIHNDDPQAVPMWMSAGSFWTQPAGEAHITAARGTENVALVEIDQGPYLVRPPGDAFDNGERPVNVEASNLVWVDQGPGAGAGARVAYLWGSLDDGAWNGTFLKLPAGFSGRLGTHGTTFHAVVIQGTVKYHGAEVSRLIPGSYFGSSDPSEHRITSDGESVLYIRTNGPYELP